MQQRKETTKERKIRELRNSAIDGAASIYDVIDNFSNQFFNSYHQVVWSRRIVFHFRKTTCIPRVNNLIKKGSKKTSSWMQVTLLEITKSEEKKQLKCNSTLCVTQPPNNPSCIQVTSGLFSLELHQGCCFGRVVSKRKIVIAVSIYFFFSYFARQERTYNC